MSGPYAAWPDWGDAEMKPTQAQIEAAAKAMNVKHYLYKLHLADPTKLYEELATAALTAAAEVENDKEYKPIYDSPANLQRMANAALVNHTIERCAQAVENCNCWPPSPKQLAAAIRALKDQSETPNTPLSAAK